ncbi:MAG: M13 family metallopeptidase [Acidobacteriota bacterium]|nr:M13 family metallopeptidase [Acidobacteriota bacterium]
MRLVKNMRRVGSVLGVLALSAATIAQSGGRGVAGFDVSRMDKTCKPCDDFYKFANGGWLEKNPVPAAYSRWGSFDLLNDSNRTALQQILEEAAKNTSAAKGSNEAMTGAFYASCMDEAKVEAEGIKPLQPELARIEKIKDLNDVGAQVAYMHRHGVPTMFGFSASADAKNSTHVIGYVGQGGLSLPNREYYTKTDDKSQQTRAEFVKHVARMFELLGDGPTKAAAGAQTVLAIQTKLAEASMTPVELRDPLKTYNKMEMAQLKELAPNISWENYFAGVGAPKSASLVVRQPAFFKALNEQLTTVPVADWKTYLRWHLINTAAPRLSTQFVNENFNFYGKTLSGAKELQPRWKRCVNATDNTLGEALGQVYVAKHFTPESKARMQGMVNNLIAAFRERLTKLDWMSDATRKEAVTKLEAFKYKIGYPDKWKDYAGLEVNRDTYLMNSMRAAAFETNKDLNKIGKPVVRTEWRMTPPTVNAYYNSTLNEIAFPAGILQFPFFNPAADDAVNYGAIGGVIGHEITHGFDDRGSQSDAVGNLRMWWTVDDRKKFEERAGCVANQFSGYEVEKGLNMMGKLVLGESIADLGGLTVAYDAFQKSMQGKPRPKDIDGFTPEQRFFLGWAQVWATTYTPQAARLQALNGPHPISRFRANGPLSNMPAFAAAFNCKQGDPMVRPAQDRCQIW